MAGAETGEAGARESGARAAAGDSDRAGREGGGRRTRAGRDRRVRARPQRRGEVRGKRLRASLDEVRAIGPAPGSSSSVSYSSGSSSPSSSTAAAAAGGSSLSGAAAGSRSLQSGAERSRSVTVNVMANVPEGGLHDLNVIGCTVPEAIERADKFLDQALLAEMREIRLIHGHGTGQLRTGAGGVSARASAGARSSRWPRRIRAGAA